MPSPVHRAVVWLAVLGVCVQAASVEERAPGDDSERTKILILGAGAAGLQAARTLHDAGVDDFIILEGGDRIGGRVCSAQFAGMTVQIGAQWAAPAGSRSDELVRELGMSWHVSDYDSLTIRNSTGHDVTDDTDAKYERLERGVAGVDELVGKLHDNLRVPDMSQRTALRQGSWAPLDPVDQAIEWFEYDFEYGERPDAVSSRRTITSAGLDEMPYVTDQRGFAHIFQGVAGFLDGPDFANHTRLNKRVTAIDYSGSGAVTVTCADGSRFAGDFALVTFSMGVLQSDLVQFSPALPEWKTVEINKVVMVGYSNIYVTFPTKFWDDTEWILYASETRGYYPLFLNYNAPGIFPEGPPILLVTVTGDESRRVEAQSPSQTKAEIEAVLRTMYGDSVPDATDILVSDWSQNPLTLGPYSDLPPEMPEQCLGKLASRVGRLFFGGEATADLNGYVSGGLVSGRREAEKILACMGLDLDECPAFQYEGDGLECDYSPSSSGTATIRLLHGFQYLALVVLTLLCQRPLMK